MDGGSADHAGAVICPRAIDVWRISDHIARKAGSRSLLF
jgi:hypothetical protein